MKKIVLLGCLCFFAANSLAQKKSRGMDFDDASYTAIPKKAKLTRGLEIVPAAGSLKKYAPTPLNQGDYGTCTSWAVAYCGRTIAEAVKNNWTDSNVINKNAYSAAFLFRLLRPQDTICKGGSSITDAFTILKEKGALKAATTPGICLPAVTSSQLEAASEFKIKDYLRLFDIEEGPQLKIQIVRKSINEKKPVVIGMLCPDSFQNCGEVWNPTEEPLPTYGGHAMCVVGYDDNKYGGAFEIQNSWGTNWGNKGYVWIKYADFVKFTKYAFQLVDLPEPKPQVPDLSGQIRLQLVDGTTMPVQTVVSANNTTYATTTAYTYGTRFRIYISNNQPAYVYALSTDLSNEIVPLFPYDESICAALTDSKNEVSIPDEDHFIQFDSKPGTDILCVLYSRNALDINDLMAKIAQQDGSFNEKLHKVLGSQLVDSNNITYTPNSLSFKGFSKGKTIIPLLVTMEHH